MGKEKLKFKRSRQLKFRWVTLQPKLELLCGPPTLCGSSPHDPQSFRLLLLAVSAGGDPPSPDGRGTCLWNAEVVLQGRNVTEFVHLHWYMSKCTSMRLFDSQMSNLRERLLPLCWFQEPGTSCSCKNPDEMIWLSSFWNVRKIYQPLKECPFLGGKQDPPKQLSYLFERRWSSQDGYASRYRTHPK